MQGFLLGGCVVAEGEGLGDDLGCAEGDEELGEFAVDGP